MKITILGCGSSGGVPLIGGVWGDCDPTNPRNRRTRVSILVEEKDTTVLVDTSPDMRQQLLDCDLKKLDAVLYTHAHADHCHGIDDLRSLHWLMKKQIDVYADKATLSELTKNFHYIFDKTSANTLYQPSAIAHEINGPFNIGELSIAPFSQNHGPIHTLGFRFGNFAYSTDVSDLDQDALAALRDVKTWVVDCVGFEPHLTHSCLKQTLDWIKEVRPERAFLTHMSHKVDYEQISSLLPQNVWPAYDGLVIEC